MIPSRAVDAAIRGYQRYLSPLKGFSCAHLVAFGGLSCSEAVRRLVADRGVLGALVPTVARFIACSQAASLLYARDRVRGVCCCGGIPIPFRF